MCGWVRKSDSGKFTKKQVANLVVHNMFLSLKANTECMEFDVREEGEGSGCSNYCTV